MKAIFISCFKSVRRTLLSKSIYYLTALLLGSVTNALAANDGFAISEVQPTRVFQKDVGDQTRISFSAYGRTFDLLLEENKPLMKKNVSRLLDLELYAGTIEGVDNSWARISIVDGEYSGAVYDGNELYMLDTGKMLSESVDTNLKQTMLETSNVVYKASDLTSTLSCGLHEKHDEAQQFSYDGLVSELRNAQQSALAESTDSITAQATATQQVNLSIVTDTQYAATSPNGVEAQVLSQMNIVDGIFSEQVGVQFGIEEIRVLTNNGPLTSSSASTLLNQFRSLIGNDNPGLAHLFTGKNLDGNTIGIAFTRAICTANGVGVTQAGGRGTTGALTAAHEFGHNFGAPHDNQGGSACASTRGNFLMNPSINGSDQFSQCSLQQIQNVLNVRSCLVDVEEPEPEPTPVANCNGQINFANGPSGYTFVDDAQTPIYTSSSVSGGALNIGVGGVDNADITNMEGAWRQQCESASGGNVTINVNGSLTQANGYEANEFSQILLRVNGDETVLATVTGNGNGGPEISTGAQQFTANASLSAGVNTVELLCFNNAKTVASEITNCSFTGINVAGVTAANILNENFNNSVGSFSFDDDDSDPVYSNGSRTTNGGVNNSGALRTTLGGVDNADISNMEAVWTRSFTTSQSGQFTLSFDANLLQTPDYEANESSEVGIMIDGQSLTLNQVAGNGNGGDNVSTGFQSYNVSFTVGAGNHDVSLFCRNSAKTFNNEETLCTFDNVVIE